MKTESILKISNDSATSCSVFTGPDYAEHLNAVAAPGAAPKIVSISNNYARSASDSSHVKAEL